jgi:hypothetical protein
MNPSKSIVSENNASRILEKPIIYVLATQLMSFKPGIELSFIVDMIPSQSNEICNRWASVEDIESSKTCGKASGVRMSQSDFRMSQSDYRKSLSDHLFML